MFGAYNRLNIHVMASDLTVLRELRTRLNPVVFRNLRKTRKPRHKLYRAILKEHANARDLYYRVMLGIS